MKTPRLKTLFVAVSLITAGFSAAAHNRGLDDEVHGVHGRKHLMSPEKMQEFHEKRSAELKAKLRLTPEQEASWSAFTLAMKPSSRPTTPALDHEALTKLPTPERLDKVQAMRAEYVNQHNAEMTKRNNAVKTFYASLSNDQKKIFDSETARMHRLSDRKEHRGERH
jgi:protein CpxP